MKADPASALGDSTYRNLAKLSTNGRQIRNVVKIAALLAAREKTKLGIHEIRTVLEATQEAGGRLWRFERGVLLCRYKQAEPYRVVV